LVADTLIRNKLPRKIIAALALTCCLIAAPLLLTDYSYGGFYSYWIVIAIIATLILFAGFNYLDMATSLKILTTIAFLGISLVPVGLTFYGRSFVVMIKFMTLRKYRATESFTNERLTRY